MSKNEKIIILAFRLGYGSVADIIDQTGLGKKTVETSLEQLRFRYKVPNEHLAAIFAPQPTEQPHYTSHDCVIIDAALAPTTAAQLIRQVLGDDYSQDLKIAL